MSPVDVVVTASAVTLPGLTARQSDALGRDTGWTGEHPADEAHLLLGRKGLLFKEPAVRLAMLAVHRALGLPPGRPTAPPDDAAGTAVVVSSNYGNVATVCDIVDQVQAGDLRGVSPMQAPNASSNIVASSIAIRYGFTGPNLMVCSGATGGLDALRLGALLVRSGRTHQAVVVGTEPGDDTTAALLTQGDPGAKGPPPQGAAGCVVLRAATGQPATTPRIHLRSVRREVAASPPPPLSPLSPLSVLSPQPALLVADRPGATGALDLSAVLGDLSGAAGVIQAALATRWLTDPATRPGQLPAASHAVLSCGPAADGVVTARLDRCDGPR